jgi:hypothetical protein
MPQFSFGPFRRHFIQAHTDWRAKIIRTSDPLFDGRDPLGLGHAAVAGGTGWRVVSPASP